MHRSSPITVGGQFVGAALSDDRELRFVAVDPRVEELDESFWPTLAALERAVAARVRLARGGARPVGSAPRSRCRV